MIVVDASLAVKWLFNENGSEHALRLLDEQRGGIAGPDLIFVEVAGVIVRRGNEVKAYGPDALETLRVWAFTVFGHAVRSHPVTSKLLFEASSMALRIGHPLKDCLYLALAMELDCDLVTCDARFRDKARPLGATVTLLQEWAARN
jgi:predicted nucleic acid-binding protein